MGLNIFELMQKYSQFQQFLKQCNRNPADLLNEELKRRGISQQQLQELLNQAKGLQNILGGRK